MSNTAIRKLNLLDFLILVCLILNTILIQHRLSFSVDLLARILGTGDICILSTLLLIYEERRFFLHIGFVCVRPPDIDFKFSLRVHLVIFDILIELFSLHPPLIKHRKLLLQLFVVLARSLRDSFVINYLFCAIR